MVAALLVATVCLVFLEGCSTTPDIVLRNSEGQTARCEGYVVASGWGRSRLLSGVQRECVQDYQRQGYERVTEKEDPK